MPTCPIDGHSNFSTVLGLGLVSISNAFYRKKTPRFEPHPRSLHLGKLPLSWGARYERESAKRLRMSKRDSVKCMKEHEEIKREYIRANGEHRIIAKVRRYIGRWLMDIIL